MAAVKKPSSKLSRYFIFLCINAMSWSCLSNILMASAAHYLLESFSSPLLKYKQFISSWHCCLHFQLKLRMQQDIETYVGFSSSSTRTPTPLEPVVCFSLYTYAYGRYPIGCAIQCSRPREISASFYYSGSKMFYNFFMFFTPCFWENKFDYSIKFGYSFFFLPFVALAILPSLLSLDSSCLLPPRPSQNLITFSLYFLSESSYYNWYWSFCLFVGLVGRAGKLMLFFFDPFA